MAVPKEQSTPLDIGLDGPADSGWRPIKDYTHIKVHVSPVSFEQVITVAWSNDKEKILSTMLHVTEAGKACAIEGKCQGEYYRVSATPKASNVSVAGGA